MLMVLLGAGIGLLVVGLGALGYGIQYKEFGFGNTLVVAGAVATCSGFLMAGLWVVARELQNISQRLSSGAAAQSALLAEPSLAPALAPPPSPRAAETAPTDAGAAPPWMEGRSDTAPGRSDTAPPPPPAEADQQPKQRRNLLFTSTSRKERERAAARASEPLAPDLLSADLRPNPPAVDAPSVEPAPPPPSFEDAWPKADRPRRPPRAAAPDVPPPAPARDQAPQVTVLKSGVVDGMAYSLYSDGSIEAQMPEGMMRFASIDELRAHLDQRP